MVVAYLAHELERDSVGNNGRIPVRDVGKRARVHKHGCLLCRLHQRRLDRILRRSNRQPNIQTKKDRGGGGGGGVGAVRCGAVR